MSMNVYMMGQRMEVQKYLRSRDVSYDITALLCCSTIT